MAKRSNRDSKLWSHKYDYPIEEVWNTSHVIARIIVSRLRSFRDLEKDSHPIDFKTTKDWNKALDKMIYAFELNMYAPGPVTGQEEKDFQEGFDLFYQYYTNLWD